MPYKDLEKRNACARNYYLRDKVGHLERRKRNKKIIKDWFNDYKKTLSCTKCGFNNPVCLDFHHTRDKVFNISHGVVMGYSKLRIISEIEKCIVLCANCHRIEHNKD